MARKPFATVGKKTYQTRAEFRAAKNELKRQGKNRQYERMAKAEYKHRIASAKQRHPTRTRSELSGHFKLKFTETEVKNLYGKHPGQEAFFDHSTRGRVTQVTSAEWARLKAEIKREAKLHPKGMSWLKVEAETPIDSPPGSGHTTSWVSTFAILTSALYNRIKDLSLDEALDAEISGPPLSNYHPDRVIGIAFAHTTENVV